MEKLKSLLIGYNLCHKEDCCDAPWNNQFCDEPFPLYWTLVYEILDKLNRECRVIEIGCGLGAITSILCYQGYKNILSFERNRVLADKASSRMIELFKRDDIVQPSEFPSENKYKCDILISVNCVYAENTETKKEYMHFLYNLYVSAGMPRVFILEVIDDSYSIQDSDFPQHIRLNLNDIRFMFPSQKLTFWSTYIYPTNKKSKTLYLIERV